MQNKINVSNKLKIKSFELLILCTHRNHKKESNVSAGFIDGRDI